METPPTVCGITKRVPTPRFSERKKKLFGEKNLDEKPASNGKQNFSIDGVKPLSPELKKIFNNNDECMNQLSKNFYYTCTDELGSMLKNSLIFKNKINDNSTNNMDSSDEHEMDLSNLSNDENVELIQETPLKCDNMYQKRKSSNLIESVPPKQVLKNNHSFNNESTNSFTNLMFPTSSFYSNKKEITRKKKLPIIIPEINDNHRIEKRHKPKIEKLLSKKSVFHKIRRPIKKKKKKKHNDNIKILTSKIIPQENLNLVRENLSKNIDSIEMSKTLNININDEDDTLPFSDFENSTDNSSDECTLNALAMQTYIGECEKSPDSKSKKIFTSGKKTKTIKEISLSGNIKAIFSNGKIQLKKEKFNKYKNKFKDVTFSEEQKAVNKIIDTLTITPTKCDQNENTVLGTNKAFVRTEENKINEYSNFLKRVPYNTTNPDIIKEQQLMLDFLLSNDLCTERNFQMFIVDPKSYKKEIDDVYNSLIHVKTPIKKSVALDKFEIFRNQLPYKTKNPSEIEQQHLLLDFLIKNNICTNENFKIFIVDPDNHKEQAEKIVNKIITTSIVKNNSTFTSDKDNIAIDGKDKQEFYPIFYRGDFIPIVHKSTRKKLGKYRKGAFGLNQYQIDAGQNAFGGKQCVQCGLIYTVHEPEEERLHYEYHNSLHILKFDRWTNEDVVNNYEEWGTDGRIIRLKDSCSAKKKERLMNVLQIVDQELGFSSYILPSSYVAFLAIRNHQIVGLCLVQFLNSANRYLSINGLDCCTEETFEAKCGISRIWVSPFLRRLKIASELILAVKSQTFEGESISIDKIAFSAPTEDGKLFAQRISKRLDFLVYQ